MPNNGLLESLLELLTGEVPPAVRVHLAVGEPKMVELILAGKKTIETRFSETRQPPFGSVEAGDIIILKKSGGPIVGIARAARATFYSHLDGGQVRALRAEFNDLVQADDEFWARKSEARYATFIYLGEVTKVEPCYICKRDRRAWVVYQTEGADDPVASEDAVLGFRVR